MPATQEKRPEPRKFCAFRLPKDTIKELARLAKRHNSTGANVIIWAVERVTGRNENEAPASKQSSYAYNGGAPKLNPIMAPVPEKPKPEPALSWKPKPAKQDVIEDMRAKLALLQREPREPIMKSSGRML